MTAAGDESPDLRAVRLAESRDGVLGTQDLRQVGLRRDAVRRRVAKGLLHRVHPGAYSLSPDLTLRGRNRAALLTCGPEAWLGARSGCAAWGFIEWDGAADVLLHGRELTRDGVNVRTTSWLPAEHRTRRHGLPVTSPGRSLLDAASLLEPALLEHAIAAALRKRWVTERELRELAATGRPGAPALRTQLDRVGGAQFSRSKAERLLLRLCRDARLPSPRLNERVGGRERDAVWLDARLVGEFDGDAFHWSPASKRDDHRRDAELELRGWGTIRITWHELSEEPLALAARLGSRLADCYAQQRYA